jgi:tripartite ATP-independent transporter DctM subunit
VFLLRSGDKEKLVILFIGIVFGVLCILGIPIAFVMGLSAIAGFIYLGNPILYHLIPQRMYAGIANYVMIAIPFFVMAGEIMTISGITEDLVKLSNALVGHLRGGLAHVVVVSSILLSGLTGSAASDAASISSVMIPSMTKEGYDLDFSGAVIAAATVNGPIIPPSIIMVIYASLMNVSVAGLFLAGYIPGLMIGFGLMGGIYFFSRKRNYPVHHRRSSLKEVYLAFKGAIISLILPFIIIGGILLGVFTPTEASVVCVAYALIVGFFIKKSLKLRHLPEIMKRTLKISSTVLFVISTSIAFGWILSLEQIPQKLASGIISMGGGNFYLTFLIFNIILFIAGMFMDTTISIILLAPILITTGIQAGIHPLHLAIVVCVNLSIGLITPPLGILLFVLCSVTKLNLDRLCRAIFPFICIEAMVCILISYLPAVCMILPKYFGFYP